MGFHVGHQPAHVLCEVSSLCGPAPRTAGISGGAVRPVVAGRFLPRWCQGSTPRSSAIAARMYVTNLLTFFNSTISSIRSCAQCGWVLQYNRARTLPGPDRYAYALMRSRLSCEVAVSGDRALYQHVRLRVALANAGYPCRNDIRIVDRKLGWPLRKVARLRTRRSRP